jgi:hypothetical protein
MVEVLEEQVHMVLEKMELQVDQAVEVDMEMLNMELAEQVWVEVTLVDTAEFNIHMEEEEAEVPAVLEGMDVE